VSRGFRCLTSCSAGFPVFVIIHVPFPSGGNRWGGQTVFVFLDAIIFVLNTLSAGFRASLSHMPMITLGYLYLYSRRQTPQPSVTRRVAVWASSVVNCGLRFFFI